MRGDGKDDVANEWFIGHPIDVWYDYKQTGVYQIGDDFELQPDDSPGNPKIQDTNGNGVIDAEDKVVLASRLPNWTAGMTNIFTYKNWELSVFINMVQGIKKRIRESGDMNLKVMMVRVVH